MTFKIDHPWGYETSLTQFEISLQVWQPNQTQPDPMVYFRRFNQPQTVTIKPTGFDKQDGHITIRIKGTYDLHGDMGGPDYQRGPNVDYWGNFEYLYTINYHLKEGDVGECTGIDQSKLTIDTPQLRKVNEGGDKVFVLSDRNTTTSQGDGATAGQDKFVKISPYWKMPEDKTTGGDGFKSGSTIKYPEYAKTWGDLLVRLQVDPLMDKAIVPKRLLELSRGTSGYFQEDQRKIDAHDKTVTPPIIDWKLALGKEFPKIFDALRDHKIPLFIAGYASTTGDKWYNYVLSADRAADIQKALKFLIGGNADIDPNPQGRGQELAQWDVEFDLAHLRLKLKPRAKDRVVAFWMDRDALTKVYQDQNPCPKTMGA